MLDSLVLFSQATQGEVVKPPDRVFLVVALVLAAIMLAGLWACFSKAGEPGWAAIVPIYNVVVMLKIAGRPLWWLVLMFIPFVNFIVSIVVAVDFGRAFGKGTGFGVGLAFLPFIFYPLLGFGDAEHERSKPKFIASKRGSSPYDEL